MAGDWIPMRVNLHDDPDVIAIAGQLGIDEDSTVGKLHRFWAWADQHTEDGNAVGVTLSWIDRRIGVTGFAAALVSRGWLEETADGFTIPNFERFLGKSGKKRAKTNKRVANHRELKRSCNAASVTKSVTREQNRREENISTPLPPKGGGAAPKFDPLAVELPPALDRDDFRAAWAEWVSHRRELRKPMTPRTVSGQLKSLAGYGPSGAVAAIRNAITQGYTGIYPPPRGHPKANGASDVIRDYLDQFGDSE